MKRLILTTAMILPLSGCGLPPAISIASLLMDIGSYAATGKSATDHVLSAMAGEDCAVVKLLEGDICEDELQFEEAVATLQPLAPGEGIEQVAQREPEAYRLNYVDPVQTGEPAGTGAGAHRIFVHYESIPEPSDNEIYAIGDEESGNVQLAAVASVSGEGMIVEDSYLSAAILPAAQALPPSEEVNIFAPAALYEAQVKSAEVREAAQVAEIQQAALPAASEAVEGDETPQRPSDDSVISANLFMPYGSDRGGRSLSDLAQARAVNGKTLHPEAEQEATVYFNRGQNSLAPSLRRGR